MSLTHRRLRTSPLLRDMVRENVLGPQDLIQPFFVIEGQGKVIPVESMPGIARLSIDCLLKEIESYVCAGGASVVLFGLTDEKDLHGHYALKENSIVPKAISAIKKNFPDLVLFSDICLCAYLSHGHCGIVKEGQIDNALTLPVLAQMAKIHAQAGVDFVAPSDMMDLRVKAIRDALDQAGCFQTGILAYSAKYASAYYGPFRDAANCAPGFGDRRTYQMDPGNAKEALKEALQDVQEGADLCMVKPALAYMDIIKILHDNLNIPIVAYNVSGEYSMVKAAAQKGYIDEKSIVLETLLGFKRAGAKLIISYHSKEALGWLQ